MACDVSPVAMFYFSPLCVFSTVCFLRYVYSPLCSAHLDYDQQAAESKLPLLQPAWVWRGGLARPDQGSSSSSLLPLGVK